MAVPKFDPKELIVASEIPSFFGPATPVYSFPVTMKEAVVALYKREPLWQITGLEQKMFIPGLNPDNVARNFVIDGSERRPSGGGTDMFGIEWEFVPSAGGSMVRPGKPFLSDANEWYDKLVFPDIDSWDWETAAKTSAQYLATDNSYLCYFFTGWFERLISFMDFENAAFALIDEDQTDAVKALFDKLSDLYIRIFEKYFECFPQIDVINIHDDWGSQRDTFFSPETAKEMIVPYMKKVTDYIHSQGRFCDLHSCGQLLKQIPNFIEAGWDSWGGQLEINDNDTIYELYGDKIILGVSPDKFDAATATEEEQRAVAKSFADKFCDPKKPTMVNFYSSSGLTRAFREELYIRSRENYSK